ncbi:hypothetical protein IVB38_11665 [Bradyrhizobium sp. 38]|uniref:hypothetical protein n=1 Tax=unclassified Bradyrhizobium TaxID=2631580 RepID=UPI001FFAAC52|nr:MULTISPECIES: hypothetical protein [unclassified Bradyrhizobium]MCK1336668.1 hypothetical protein [Bradyrhizobium sp. 38]MCK1777018.1 hypothetical protein [Bradyrhizobium sp. 132]
MAKADASPCRWISGHQAFREFATHEGKTQSARHIKPLHWYIACRLVLEGGFHPNDITPRPPFVVETKKGRKGRVRNILKYDPKEGRAGEQVILGGLKTKNVDVVVDKKSVGPVLAISCKGVTKAFRNLTNRMEETIGECTNLHITYPAMVVGYFSILRANRTIEDALAAPDLDVEDTPTEVEVESDSELEPTELTPKKVETLKANDIAILEDGSIVEGIVRFHAALREMTSRRGLRDEISRYEAMTMALIEPRGDQAGDVVNSFPPDESPLHLSQFFATLYRRYEERFVLGAPLLSDRGITKRLDWDPDSPVFSRPMPEAKGWPELDFEARLATPAT